MTRLARIADLDRLIPEALAWGERTKADLLRMELAILLEEERRATLTNAARCFMAAREVPLPAELLVEPILN